MGIAKLFETPPRDALPLPRFIRTNVFAYDEFGVLWHIASVKPHQFAEEQPTSSPCQFCGTKVGGSINQNTPKTSILVGFQL